MRADLAAISFRDRIDRFVGVDIHAPATPLPYLDEFATIDLCGDGASFAEGSFDLVLSNFTVEHFADPAARSRTCTAGCDRAERW